MIRHLNILAGAALAAVLLAGCGGKSSSSSPATPSVINFAVLPAEDQATFEPLWKPMLDDMSKAVGVPVKAYFTSNYAAVVQAMGSDQVQVGWYSAEPAVEAVRRSKGEVFARTYDMKGKDTYTSVVIVKKGAGVTLDRILKCDHSLAFGMGEPKSTSGTLAPMVFLFQPHHVDPSNCFKQVRNASHNANLMAVAEGLQDGSTNNSVGLEWAEHGDATARKAFANLQVVWESPPIPESALLYRADLDPGLKHRIRDFFITYGKAPGAEGERQKAILAKLHYTAFNPASDDYLAPVRQMQAATTGAK